MKKVPDDLAPTCPHCSRTLEDGELTTGVCTSDDCLRHDTPEVQGWVYAALLLCLLLAGCSRVSPQHVDEVTHACSGRGGWWTINDASAYRRRDGVIRYTLEATCQDGSTIERRWVK